MEFIVKATAAGGAGTSTASANTEQTVRGFLEAVEYLYTNAPVTTTITVTENDALGRKLATVAAGNTNGVQYPRAASVDTAGTAITNSFSRIYLSGYTLNVAIGAANNGTLVVVRFYISETFRE